MSKSLERIGIVSVATVLSRVLGLLRDMLTLAVFGVSGVSAAFFFAFTLPNLFRRLLGEGSLTAAAVPVLTEELENGGRARVFTLVNQVFSWLFVVTTFLTLALIAVFLLIPLIDGLEERWYLTSELAVFLFPYMILVCLAAALAAALNVLGRFAVPALTAVWLNLAMIAGLGAGAFFFAESAEGRVLFLCFGVLAGGLLQLLIPLIALVREGWRPKPDLTLSPRLREVRRLMIPGLAGTAIFQINVLVSRSLAFGVDEAGVSVLYLANRLMEFPLGIFTMAVATVIFPLLSLHAVRNDAASFGEVYRKGLRLILMISLPAAAGIAFLSDPILGLLFQRGAFEAGATAITAPVLAIYAVTLPLYSIATFATRGFHSLKNTATPVRLAGAAFLINLVCSLLLMRPLGIIGLALANLISILVQSAWLQVSLATEQRQLGLLKLTADVVKMAAATAVMSLLLVLLREPLLAAGGGGKAGQAVVLGLLIPGGAGFYFLLLWVLRVEGRDEASALLRRMAGRDRAARVLSKEAVKK